MTLVLRPRPRRRAHPGPFPLSVERARTIVYTLLVLFWFTLPWESVIRFSGGATLARALGAVLFVGAACGLVLSGRRTRLSEYTVLMMAFAAIVLLSTFWTATAGATRERVITMAQLVVMVLITWEFGHTRRRVEGLMAAWVAGSVVVGLVASWGFLTGESETRYTAPGTSHGDVAYALLVAIPMAWYLSIKTHHIALVWAYRLFVPFALFAVVLTASRAGLLSMGLAIAVIPFTLPWVSPRGRIALAGATLACAAGALTLATVAAGPIARLSTTSSEISSGTLDARTTLWGIALRLIAAHPFLGLGAGGSKTAVSGQFELARGLHNTFLSVAVELGLLGLAVFLLMAVAALYRPLTQLPPLEQRIAWILAIVFLVSLLPRHADYFKSTYALFTLLALMGEVMVRAAPTAPRPTRDPTSDGPARQIPGKVEFS